jgi:glutaredoxin
MFVIYSKSDCLNCAKAKLLLHDKSKIVVNCDELLKTDRESFMNEMEKKMKCKFKSFPMIFIDDIYLGGYDELVDHLQFELVEEF